MKKIVILGYFLLFGVIIVTAQTLNSSETTKLKLFLAQESDVSGKKNYQQLGIQNLETVDWRSIAGLVWSSNGRLDSMSWVRKNLGGHLDLSGFTALRYVRCEENGITSIDVTGCTNLIYFWCLRNKLTSIDISTNIKLEDVCVRYQNAPLKAIDLTNNPKLTFFCGSGNQFEYVDLSNNPLLETFSSRFNNIRSIDVSKNLKLRNLYLRDNQLTEITILNHPELTHLECFNNQLIKLNVSGCSNLKILRAYNNLLKEIKIDYLDMDELNCEDNFITFSTIPKLKSCENFLFTGQKRIKLTVPSNRVDLSREYKVGGAISEFIWSNYINPTESKEGVFTFSNSVKNATCYVTNTSFMGMMLTYDIELFSAQSVDIPQDIDVFTQGNLLYLKTNQPLTATIYTISGVLVNQLVIVEGENVVPLSSGIYIVKLSNGLVRKVMIR